MKLPRALALCFACGLAACAQAPQRGGEAAPASEAQFQAAELFDRDAAQLQLTALKPLAEFATSVNARGDEVVQIIALAADEGGLDLAEDRAAALADYLMRHGVLPARLRYESRVDADRAEKIFLVQKIVASPNENDAWIPPERLP